VSALALRVGWTRAPERLVRVDVADAGHRALVEQRGLHHHPPRGEALAEELAREAGRGGLGPEAVDPPRAVLVAIACGPWWRADPVVTSRHALTPYSEGIAAMPRGRLQGAAKRE